MGVGPDCEYDYFVCMVGQTEARSYQDYAYRLVSRLSVGQGRVCHKIQRKVFGKWKTYDGATQCLDQGRGGFISKHGVHRTRRAQTYNVDGNDRYSWMVYNYG